MGDSYKLTVKEQFKLQIDWIKSKVIEKCVNIFGEEARFSTEEILKTLTDDSVVFMYLYLNLGKELQSKFMEAPQFAKYGNQWVN